MSFRVYKIKSTLGRAVAFASAVGMLGGLVSAALPGIAAADAYNPLTERSLMLSSSSPGWAYTDGSGNSGTTFSQPGSGANGLKTEETFSFKVSTDSSGAGPNIKAMTLQYCTTPAGNCTPPGNGTTTASQQSNLDIIYTSPAETTDFEVRSGASTWGASTQSTDWTMKTYRLVDAAGATTSEKNFILLTHDETNNQFEPAGGEMVWVRFKASTGNYITNPGAGAFFVKINTFDTDDTVTTDTTPANGIPDDVDPLSTTGQGNIIDGGVTVANVMNQSIWITTKVLETMAFSVGLTNPDLVNSGNGTHGPCDSITNNTELHLGDPAAEYSLQFNNAWDAVSYWRLSTNSSAGATVYYSGNTLNNTVGDNIDASGATKQHSHPGEEQFGLAIDNRLESTDPEANDAPDNALSPLVATTDYNGGGDPDISDSTEANNAEFAFDTNSDFEPVPIAANSSGVLQCATAKMRYVGNIAPFTPAGVYTTKINYIAAPKY
jgi:hypothetical protein